MKERFTMKSHYKTGAVSLFIVVFSALLMTVVTLGFITQMVANQQRATSDDLSQSALDSAQAGVEDAKRALIQYEGMCGGIHTAPSCSAIETAMTQCNKVFTAPGLSVPGTTPSADGSIPVGSGTTDSTAYQQAYTCVKINVNTNNYAGKLAADGSALIPLVSGSAFDSVEVSWTSKEDLQGADGFLVDLQAPSASPALNTDWPVNRPAVMRTQLVQYDSTNGFKLSDFDNNSGEQTDNSTLFLYPTGQTGQQRGGGSPISLFTARKTSAGTTGVEPTNVTCSGDLKDGGYSCHQILTLPQAVGGGAAISFLRLISLYNGSHFQLRLMDGNTTVPFKGVQPEIDSTGRANNLYKRIATRVVVEYGGIPYPNGEVDTTSSLCKDFVVTDVEPATNNCKE